MAKKLVQQQCGTCKYSSSDKIGDQTVYFCRYNPPQLTPIPGQSSFPGVKPEWWCGRYEAT